MTENSVNNGVLFVIGQWYKCIKQHLSFEPGEYYQCVQRFRDISDGYRYVFRDDRGAEFSSSGVEFDPAQSYNCLGEAQTDKVKSEEFKETSDYMIQSNEAVNFSTFFGPNFEVFKWYKCLKSHFSFEAGKHYRCVGYSVREGSYAFEDAKGKKFYISESVFDVTQCSDQKPVDLESLFEIDQFIEGFYYTCIKDTDNFKKCGRYLLRTKKIDSDNAGVFLATTDLPVYVPYQVFDPNSAGPLVIDDDLKAQYTPGWAYLCQQEHGDFKAGQLYVLNSIQQRGLGEFIAADRAFLRDNSNNEVFIRNGILVNFIPFLPARRVVDLIDLKATAEEYEAHGYLESIMVRGIKNTPTSKSPYDPYGRNQHAALMAAHRAREAGQGSGAVKKQLAVLMSSLKADDSIYQPKEE